MSDKNIDAHQMRSLMTTAEHHFNRGEWQLALDCFERVLDLDESHQAARDGRNKAQEKLEREAEIRDKLAEGRSLLDAQRYKEASQTFNQAQDMGATHNILVYHAEIRNLRDRAQETLAWHVAVESSMAHARNQEGNGAIDQAIATLRSLLHDLTKNGHEELGQAAREKLNALLLTREVEVQVAEAQQAFENQDYERACQIAQDLAERHSDRADVRRNADRYCRLWGVVREQLQQAQTSLAEGRFDDAVVMIRKVRDNIPNNPNWQALWLHAYSGHGNQLMAQARAALVQQEFSNVTPLIEKADAAFKAVLEVFPGHESSERALKELNAWRSLTPVLLQVRRDEVTMQWDTALSMLGQAREHAAVARSVHGEGKVVDAKQESSAYADVDGMLQSMESRIFAARQRISDARAALRDGVAAMEQKRLDRAEEYFRRGLDRLEDLSDDMLERELLAGKQQAAAERDRILNLLEQAQAQDDASQSIATLQQVYEAWPTAPKMPALLGDKLLAEMEAALGAKRNERAADYARRILGLALLPDDYKQRAQELLDQVDCGNQVQSAVRDALQRHDAAVRSGVMPTVDEYRAIELLLTEADERARRNCPERADDVAKARTLVQPMMQALEKAWPAISVAQAAQSQGNWEEAAAHLAEAVAAMGERCPAALRGEAQRVGQIAAEVKQQIDLVRQALDKAQTAYQSGQRGRLNEIDWDALFSEIGVTLPAIEKVKKMAEPAPPALAALERQCADLQTRGRLLHEVFDFARSGREIDALQQARAASGRFPNDAVMTAVVAHIRQEQSASTRARADAILSEARAAAMRGEWDNALERLNEATGLELDRNEIERERQRINRQRQIWDEIKKHQSDAELKRTTNSRIDAKRAYDQAIQLVLYPDSGVEAEQRATLVNLRSYVVNLQDPLVYATQGAALTQQAREALDTVERSGVSNPLAGQLSTLVREWYELSLSHARFGFMSSAVELGQHGDAYAVAKVQMQATPDDAESRQRVTELRTKILDGLRDSVEKRITRAEETAKEGIFDKALDDLATIDELVKPMRERFPELGGDDTLQEKLQRAEAMQTQLVRLQQTATKLEPLVVEIEKAYTAGNLSEAGRWIAEAEVIDPERRVKFLWDRVESLRALIQRRRQESAAAEIDELILRARIRVETEESISRGQMMAEVVTPLEENLARVRGLDRQRWGVKQQEFEELLIRARERLRSLQDIELAWQTARDQIAAEAWEEAMQSLERGKAKARGEMAENIQREIERIRPLAEIQRRRREAVETGKRELGIRRFTAAIDAFASAMQLDAPRGEIQPYLTAAQAGEYLERANAQMITNPKDAEQLLQTAIRLAGEGEPARELRREAEASLAEITKRLEHVARIEQLVNVAEGALAMDELKQANDALDAILRLDQGHPSAQALKRKVNDALRAQTLLDSAAGHYQGKRYREAIELVEKSLTLYPLTAAQSLAASLHAEQDAGEALTRAQSLAQEGRFAQARSELEAAREKNPTHPRLPEAQQTLKDMEEQFIVRQRRPITEAYNKKDYRTAIRASESALKAIDLPDWRQEFQMRQQTIFDEWQRQLTAEAQRLLALEDGEQIDAGLARITEQINDALSMANNAAERARQELRNQVAQLEVRRGLLRLREGQRLLLATILTAADIRRCQQIAQEVLEKAEALNDFDLRWKAIDFQELVEEKRRSIVQTEHDNRLQSARELFRQAASATDLERARQRADEILAMPEYARDPGATSLRSQIDDEMKRLRVTTDRLETAKRSLRNGNYGGAQDTLQSMDDPSRLMHAELERLTNLAADLANAESQEAANPQLALEIYERAGASGYDLGAALTGAIRRCRASLVEKVETDVNGLLLAPTPDAQTAQQRLRQAHEQNWVQNLEQEQRFAQLEKLALRKAKVAQAIQILEQNAKTSEAITLLEEARQALPAGNQDKIDEGWLAIAQARVALEAGRLDETQRLLHSAPAELRQTRVFVQSEIDLAQARQSAQLFSQAATELDRLLAAPQPDFAEAIQVARRLPPGNSLTRRVRAVIEETLARRRQAEDYRAVRLLAEQLQTLQPDDVTGALKLLNEAETERKEKLAAALTRVEEALGKDDTDTAGRLITRARGLDLDAATPRIGDLEHRLRARQPILTEMRHHINNAHEAMLKSDYPQAVTSALQAQQLAAQHPAVVELVSDTRAQLRIAIDQHLVAEHYYPALQLCDLALRLGPDSAFTTLRAQIDGRRRAALDKAVGEATQALLLLDLMTANAALSTARTIQADDLRVGRLERQLQERKDAASGLRQAMERGWDALQRRDLDGAGAQFRTAAEAVSDFTEPQLWRNYIDNLKVGIAQVEEQKYESAVNSLNQCEVGLRYAPGAALSPLWGERLLQERRRAVYHALRLRQQAQEMADARRQTNAAQQQGDRENRLKYLRNWQALERDFPAFARTVFEPDASFSAVLLPGDGPRASEPPRPQTAAAAMERPAASSVANNNADAAPPSSSAAPIISHANTPMPKVDTQPLGVGGNGAREDRKPATPAQEPGVDLAGAWDDFFGEHAVKPAE